MPYKKPIQGVYAIESSISKIVYIGSSANVQLRMNLHKSAIKRADVKRYCKALYDAVMSGEVLTYVILEECSNYLEREQYWIDLCKTKGFNIINVFNADRKDSLVPDEFRNKMSAILTERWKEPIYRTDTLERLKATQFKKGSG